MNLKSFNFCTFVSKSSFPVHLCILKYKKAGGQYSQYNNFVVSKFIAIPPDMLTI